MRKTLFALAAATFAVAAHRADTRPVAALFAVAATGCAAVVALLIFRRDTRP